MNPQVSQFNKNGENTHAIIIETGLSRREALALEQKITDKHGARHDGNQPSIHHQRPTVKTRNIEEYVKKYGESPNRSTGGRY